LKIFSVVGVGPIIIKFVAWSRAIAKFQKQYAIEHIIVHSGFMVKQIRPKYFTYDKLIESLYGTSKPKKVFGKIRYRYFELMSFLNLKQTNSFLRFIQKYENMYLANVSYNAVCIKAK
jgi:hypothetical protein